MHDGLGSRLDAQLAEDRVDVELHGVVADAEALRDLLVREAAGEKLQHLELAMRERLFQFHFRPSLRRRGTRDHLVEHRQPFGDGVECGLDLRDARGAHQKAADSGALERRGITRVGEQHDRRQIELPRERGHIIRSRAAIDGNRVRRRHADARPQVIIDGEVSDDVERGHRFEHRQQTGARERVGSGHDDAQDRRPLLQCGGDRCDARGVDAHGLLGTTIAYSEACGYHPRALNVIETGLPGVLLLEPKVFSDARGFFLETYNAGHFRHIGIDGDFVQDNHSQSRRGVLRGLHYQEPNAQGKLVRCSRGVLFDVAVDIRVGSPHFGKWYGAELSEENMRMLWIPPGFAHGFCALSDPADLIYKCTALYDASSDRAIAWNDPDIGIEWPVSHPVLSPKDAEAPRLKDATILPSYG